VCCQAACACSLQLVVWLVWFYFLFVCLFVLEALRAMGFPLSTAFIVTHKFGFVVASFSLNSKKKIKFLYFFFGQVIIQ
jgi:hypothetical protein